MQVEGTAPQSLAELRVKARRVGIRLALLQYDVSVDVADDSFVHVVPAVKGLATKRFWLHVGAAAVNERLLWGGFEGLSNVQHAVLRRALLDGEFDKAMSMKMGAHPERLSIAT